jgi:F0F1-type ATP synthase membrane subunit c/vacuolar-type H+-ATPase subunit K
LAGSIRAVLPAAFLISPESLFAGAGGIAAAIAIGAFAGQALSVIASAPERQRHRQTALAGLIGLVVMIGLILLSAGGR